jgi:hypothetical protein
MAGLLCLILLAPLALVDMPPLLDYPNHLARALALAFGSGDPLVSRMYAARWAIIPNLGTDLVLPPLLHLLPVHVAGRLVVGLVILLPVIGTIAYSRVTFGSRSLWPLASGLVAYNATLLLGFLNFVAVIGVALLLAAGWIAWRERHPVRSVVLASVGSVVLFFCHLMGLVFFYVLVAGHELALSFRPRPPNPLPRGEREILLRHRTRLFNTLVRLLALVPSFVVSLGLYFASPLASLADDAEFASLPDKARQLMLPFANYILPLDIATASVVGAFVLACLTTHRCRVLPSGLLALLMTALLFLAAPSAFKGTQNLDARFVIMLAFLLFGALLPVGLPRVAMLSAIAAFVVLFCIRTSIVAFAWYQHSHDIADLRGVIASVQPGERVLIASVSPMEAPDYWRNVPLGRRLSLGIRLDDHIPALLLIERRAYWPFLFDNPSQQPITTLQPYRQLAERIGATPDHRLLAIPGKVDLCGYDELLLLDAGGEPDLAHFAADRLVLLAQTDIAALFRIKTTACGS